MAGESLWLNSNGEIIQCAKGHIAFTEDCPCSVDLYFPGVWFQCGYKNTEDEKDTCVSYGHIDKIFRISFLNSKVSRVYMHDTLNDYIDVTEYIKDGTYKMYTYVRISSNADADEAGSLGEKASKTYAKVVFPGGSDLNFMNKGDALKACFYAQQDIPWIVPSAWYEWQLVINTTLTYGGTGFTQKSGNGTYIENKVPTGSSTCIEQLTMYPRSVSSESLWGTTLEFYREAVCNEFTLNCGIVENSPTPYHVTTIIPSNYIPVKIDYDKLIALKCCEGTPKITPTTLSSIRIPVMLTQHLNVWYLLYTGDEDSMFCSTYNPIIGDCQEGESEAVSTNFSFSFVKNTTLFPSGYTLLPSKSSNKTTKTESPSNSSEEITTTTTASYTFEPQNTCLVLGYTLKVDYKAGFSWALEALIDIYADDNKAACKYTSEEQYLTIYNIQI